MPKSYGTFDKPLERKAKPKEKKPKSYGTFQEQDVKSSSLRDQEPDESGLDYKHQHHLAQHSLFSPASLDSKRSLSFSEEKSISGDRKHHSHETLRYHEQFLLHLLREEQVLKPADDKIITSIIQNIRDYIAPIVNIYKAQNPDTALDLEQFFLRLLNLIKQAPNRDILIFYSMQFVWIMNSLRLYNSDILQIDPLINSIRGKIELLKEASLKDEKSPIPLSVAHLIHAELELFIKQAAELREEFHKCEQKMPDDSPEIAALRHAIQRIDLLCVEAIKLQENIDKSSSVAQFIKVLLMGIDTLRAITITGGMHKENINYVRHHQDPVSNFFISECLNEAVTLTTQLYSNLPLLTTRSENIYISLQIALLIAQGANIPHLGLGDISPAAGITLSGIASAQDLTRIGQLLKEGIHTTKEYIKENPIDSSMQLLGFLAFPLLFIPSLPIAAIIALEAVSTAATGKSFFNYLRTLVKESESNESVLVDLNQFETLVELFIYHFINDIEKQALAKQALLQIRELLVNDEKVSEQEMKQYFQIIDKSLQEQIIAIAKISSAHYDTRSIIHREIKAFAYEMKHAGIEAKGLIDYLLGDADANAVLAILVRRHREEGRLSHFLQVLVNNSKENKHETGIHQRLANECRRIIPPDRFAEMIPKINQVADALTEVSGKEPKKQRKKGL